MQRIARLQRAAAQQQFCRGFARIHTGGFKGAGFQPVAVGAIEQLCHQRRKCFGQATGDQLGAPGFHLFGFAGAARLSRQRRLQDFGRRLAKAPFALAVEIHRRAMQGEQQCCHFRRAGRVTVVFAGKIGDGKFTVFAHFPQKRGIQRRRVRLPAIEQRLRLGRGVFEDDVGAFDLHPLAVRSLHLQGSARFREDGSGTKHATVFKQYKHAWHHARANERARF